MAGKTPVIFHMETRWGVLTLDTVVGQYVGRGRSDSNNQTFFYHFERLGLELGLKKSQIAATQ